MDYRTTVFLLYLCFIVRAAVVSKDMVATTRWMVGSLLVTYMAAYAGMSILAKLANAHGNIGAATVDFFAIPAFIVPAIVGSLHAHRTQQTALKMRGPREP